MVCGFKLDSSKQDPRRYIENMLESIELGVSQDCEQFGIGFRMPPKSGSWIYPSLSPCVKRPINLQEGFEVRG